MMRLRGLMLFLWLTAAAQADPCGMVPPIRIDPGPPPLKRVGYQQTYVFYKEGMEAFAIRPGFEGRVEEFGMLIPFPSPPSLRKIPDETFEHLAAAVEPPAVVIDLTAYTARAIAMPVTESADSQGLQLKREEVRVLREEAVGMYEVAVLEAGSSAALKRWMDDHGYRYPTGMDRACDEYVDAGWCFVAVKTRVGRRAGVDPRPGMRQVNPKKPADATFDGHVQGMAFRFPSDRLVVPMRLSAFNEGKLDNIVYVLSEQPVRIGQLPESFVTHQLAGDQVYRHVTEPLPLKVVGGTLKDVPPLQLQQAEAQRNPEPRNGIAKELFAADLLAVREKRLAHDVEEREKMLLRIGERLELRGPEIDALNLASLQDGRKQMVAAALQDLNSMALTKIEGEFPRDVVARDNLRFDFFEMKGFAWTGKRSDPAAEPGTFPGSRPTPAASPRPSPSQAGRPAEPIPLRAVLGVLAAALLVVGFGLLLRWRNAPLAVVILALGCGLLLAGEGWTQESPDIQVWIDQLSDSEKVNGAIEALVARGQESVPALIRAARGEVSPRGGTEGGVRDSPDLVRRGFAVVCLSEIGGGPAEKALKALYADGSQPALVRTWAAAGRVAQAKTLDELSPLFDLVPAFPAVARPLGLALRGLAGTDAETLLSLAARTLTLRPVPTPAPGVPQGVPSSSYLELQQELSRQVLALGPEPLLLALRTSKEVNVRQTAAQYLSTLAAQGDRSIPGRVLKAYRFDPEARELPWAGGPLFIPGISWSKPDARALIDHLVRWSLWCELHGKKDAEKRPIDNNLRGYQLWQAAGVSSADWYNASGARAWLSVWRTVAGKKRIQEILEEQKAGPEYR